MENIHFGETKLLKLSRFRKNLVSFIKLKVCLPYKLHTPVSRERKTQVQKKLDTDICYSLIPAKNVKQSNVLH